MSDAWGTQLVERDAELQRIGVALEQAEVLRPAPLTSNGVTEVLGVRMTQTVAPEFGVACHAAVGGSPFLLSELAGALVADGVRPSAEAAARVRYVRPPTLSRGMLLRLSRMPAGAAELAKVVAVLGEGVASSSLTVVDTVQWDSTIADENPPVSLLAVATVTTGQLRIWCFHSGDPMTPGGAASNTSWSRFGLADRPGCSPT